MTKRQLATAVMALLASVGAAHGAERVSINADWRFIKGDPADNKVVLSYMVRPPVIPPGRGAPAATQYAATAGSGLPGIYPWILPTRNGYVKGNPVARPAGNLGEGVAYVAPALDESAWRKVELPHDWAIEGPFMPAGTAGSDPQTGRLPYMGVGWYRKHLEIPASDAGKKLYLDVDGAMSYATVWLNGQIVGGWPMGYTSWRLDLTPYAKPGGENVLAIRLENPADGSRWYSGAGIYRNVWLVRSNPIHIAHWGTFVTTPEVSKASATVEVSVKIENESSASGVGQLRTWIYEMNPDQSLSATAVASLTTDGVQLNAGSATTVTQKFTIPNPKLWSLKTPQRYVARTSVIRGAAAYDSEDTPFGIRTIKFDPNNGFQLNGERVQINGVCMHHDLGALGAAYNDRAQERQLEMLREMGCNAIRTSHNAPSPEFLDLCDRMGILVMDEIFDVWRLAKNTRPNGYNLIFDDWSEADARAMVRRDRNHPSIIIWGIGNEILEQRLAGGGAAEAQRLTDIVKEEDPTRPSAAATHDTDPNGPFPKAMGIMGINYDQPKRQPDIYKVFHDLNPNQFVFGSETVSTVSSRGEYFFPVAPNPGAISRRSPNAPAGTNYSNFQISSYDLYYPNWATTPDTEWTLQDRNPFVGGEFVWTGWDYLGEPTPYDRAGDGSRSSYFGIIDLAGFKKDRFYIYQGRWRPDFPMAHILPHWNWPERAGQVTPVHIYTSGDEAELFLNGKSMGRKKKAQYEYRLRFDDVVYEPGEVRVVAYKAGKEWATNSVKTTGAAAKLLLKPDRAAITADGKDLSFVTLTIADASDLMVPRSKNPIRFEISGPGEIVATDNGDATDYTVFASKERKAFNGLALAIIKAKPGQPGTITVTAKSEGLTEATTTITTK